MSFASEVTKSSHPCCQVFSGVFTPIRKRSGFSPSVRRFSPKRSMNLTDAQVSDLASSLVGIVEKFYEDPKHEEEFQKWLKERESTGTGSL